MALDNVNDCDVTDSEVNAKQSRMNGSIKCIVKKTCSSCRLILLLLRARKSYECDHCLIVVFPIGGGFQVIIFEGHWNTGFLLLRAASTDQIFPLDFEFCFFDFYTIISSIFQIIFFLSEHNFSILNISVEILPVIYLFFKNKSLISTFWPQNRV